MKVSFSLVVLATVWLASNPLQAQMGSTGAGLGPQGGMSISPATARLFGDNTAFNAAMEMEAKMGAQQVITMPSRLSFDQGKSRMDMDLTNLRGATLPPEAMTQVKQLGMAQMAMISRPDRQVVYLVFPAIRTYVEMTMPKTLAGQKIESMTLTLLELGKEMVGNQPTVKNKATVTDSSGKVINSTVWNSTALKQFPVKIETVEQGTPVTISFRNVNLGKQPAATFEPPAGFVKYTNMMEMTQAAMLGKIPPGSATGQTNRQGQPLGQPSATGK